MKATQRVSALRGGQPDDLIASGAGCEGISLRGASMRRKIGPNRPGIRGILVNTYSEIVGGADTADGKEHAFFFADRNM
jgi:probable HAF family extracellular repeat protein